MTDKTLFGKDRPAPRPAKAKPVKAKATAKAKPHPRYRRPPKAVVYTFYVDRDGDLHIVVPVDARCVDVAKTWGAAQRELRR